MSFPDGFLWGTATAAAQIEGGWDEDGRTPSIWDVNPDGYVAHNDTCHTACDHYHRYREDVEIMKKLGMKAYRFSISWSRIVPSPGVVNEKGVKFYSDLIDALLEAGIEPMATMYHFDLPLWSHEKGGYMSEEFADDFLFYTKVLMDEFSDRIRYWFTMNEPSGFVRDYAVRVPDADVKVMTRNVLLAHGRAVRLMRETGRQDLKIGFVDAVMNSEPVPGIMTEEEAYEDTYSDYYAVGGMRWWCDPVYLGVVPEPLKGVISEADAKEICQPLDYFAGNIYFSANYFNEPETPGSPGRKAVVEIPGMPRTRCQWPVNPDCLYWFVKFAYRRYGLPVLVSENGCSCCDRVMLDGKVHDPERIDYIHRVLRGLKRIIEEGVPVIGYMVWSILDNFEWNSGYDQRLGLVYVDYMTQERTLKDSAYDYAEIVRTNGEEV